MSRDRSVAFMSGLLLVLAVVFVGTAGANAQTRRKHTASPVATPTPTPGDDAEVVSRASDQTDPAYVQPTTGTAAPATDPQADANAQKVKDLTARIKKLEAARDDPYEDNQKRVLMNLDILTRAEQRSDSLRKQLFEMIDKEDSIQTRLEKIGLDDTPEAIDRSATYSGSMHPEEIREAHKKSLDAEKQNLTNLLTQVQATRASLEDSLAKSDALVVKLRAKLEKDIDDSLNDDTAH